MYKTDSHGLYAEHRAGSHGRDHVEYHGIHRDRFSWSLMFTHYTLGPILMVQRTDSHGSNYVYEWYNFGLILMVLCHDA